MEDHIAKNDGAASIRAVLPTGSRENCEVSIGRNAVLWADFINRMRCAIRVECKDIVVGTAA